MLLTYRLAAGDPWWELHRVGKTFTFLARTPVILRYRWNGTLLRNISGKRAPALETSQKSRNKVQDTVFQLGSDSTGFSGCNCCRVLEDTVTAHEQSLRSKEREKWPCQQISGFFNESFYCPNLSKDEYLTRGDKKKCRNHPWTSPSTPSLQPAMGLDGLHFSWVVLLWPFLHDFIFTF